MRRSPLTLAILILSPVLAVTLLVWSVRQKQRLKRENPAAVQRAKQQAADERARAVWDKRNRREEELMKPVLDEFKRRGEAGEDPKKSVEWLDEQSAKVRAQVDREIPRSGRPATEPGRAAPDVP
jgi:hypothetical protein